MTSTKWASGLSHKHVPPGAIEDGTCTEQDAFDRLKADYLRESAAWRSNQFLQI